MVLTKMYLTDVLLILQKLLVLVTSQQKTMISSILLGEKTFYTAFCLIIKLFIMSTDQHQLVWGFTWHKKKDMWLSSQLRECIMWLKIVQSATIRKIVAYLIKNDWIYNSNNNCVLMAIKKDYFPKKMVQKVQIFWTFLLFLRFTKIFSSVISSLA